MQRLLLIAGLIILFAAEMLRIYFIMPFPGSQHGNTIDIAYFLGRYIWHIRIVVLLLLAIPVYQTFAQSRKWKKILLSMVLLLYAVIFYFVNFRFQADKMFYQPQHKNLVSAADNKVPLNRLVIGVSLNNEAKAYPIEIIGYHHQVQDTIAGQPVIVTYCTVCRTGRIFSPVVNGKKEKFRLVGMDHFNAMFEDSTTKSWWRQVTGEAITGPLKGSSLQEISSQQMTLSAWLRAYPGSSILQPDTIYNQEYEDLEGFDNGTIESGVEKRDSVSWQRKSWVIGIVANNYAKAYDWNDLVKQKLIEDSLPGLPIIITLEKDTASYHVWSRILNGQNLHFTRNNAGELRDNNTQSLWNDDGICTEGILKGQMLGTVQASQEFWHSWQTFHPATVKYSP